MNTIRRGGAERQLATIIEYSKRTINEIASFYYTRENYFNPVNNKNKVHVLDHQTFTGRYRSMQKLLWEIRPDIVYAWGTLPYNMAKLACWGTRTKVINGSVRHGVFKYSLAGLIRALSLHFSPLIVANSRAGLKANGLRRGYVLYNGVSEKFK